MQGITVATPPITTEIAQQLLAALAAESGVVTDYNVGSQIRTLAEAIGSVGEISGISALATALEVIAFSGMSIFNISPNRAVPATGTAAFATAFIGSPPPAVQNIAIPAGTLLQTLAGVQFQTSANATLVSGATGVSAPIVAVGGGLNSNVPAGSINQILTGLTYPLAVTNLSVTSGGLDAETTSQALSRLAAKLSSLVGGSPVSVANSVIGVVASGGTETVKYSTCYEPWADPNSANFGGSAFFGLYIDNGSGAASPALLTAATTKLNGNFATATPAYRPSGVPFAVVAVQPIGAVVAVTGTLGPLAIQSQVSGAIAAAVSGYFTLAFGTPAEQAQIAAAVSNAALGQMTSFSVTLAAASASGTAVPVVSGTPYSRVVLSTLTISVS